MQHLRQWLGVLILTKDNSTKSCHDMADTSRCRTLRVELGHGLGFAKTCFYNWAGLPWSDGQLSGIKAGLTALQTVVLGMPSKSLDAILIHKFFVSTIALPSAKHDSRGNWSVQGSPLPYPNCLVLLPAAPLLTIALDTNYLVVISVQHDMWKSDQTTFVMFSLEEARF
jgi:hypothetical protein